MIYTFQNKRLKYGWRYVQAHGCTYKNKMEFNTPFNQYLAVGQHEKEADCVVAVENDGKNEKVIAGSIPDYITEVSGKTYDFKDLLKSYGFKFNKTTKAWERESGFEKQAKQTDGKQMKERRKDPLPKNGRIHIENLLVPNWKEKVTPLIEKVAEELIKSHGQSPRPPCVKNVGVDQYKLTGDDTVAIAAKVAEATGNLDLITVWLPVIDNLVNSENDRDLTTEYLSLEELLSSPEEVAPVMVEQSGEIERLRAENAAFRAEGFIGIKIDDFEAEIKNLRSENEALKAKLAEADEIIGRQRLELGKKKELVSIAVKRALKFADELPANKDTVFGEHDVELTDKSAETVQMLLNAGMKSIRHILNLAIRSEIASQQILTVGGPANKEQVIELTAETILFFESANIDHQKVKNWSALINKGLVKLRKMLPKEKSKPIFSQDGIYENTKGEACFTESGAKCICTRLLNNHDIKCKTVKVKGTTKRSFTVVLKRD